MSSSSHGGDDHEPHVEAETRAVGPSASAVGIQVMVLSGSAKGTVRPLGEKLRIGKATDNDLVLADDTVSRHHCELTRSSAGIHVRDL
jgi:pSer/pThr/pTyr-binding forkhead associated (FHA) protein